MIGIIGAGALGLYLGNYLKLNNIDFKIFEANKVGAKILASGNGRCNIGNDNIDLSFYHNPKLTNFINYKDKVYKLLNDLGIYTKSDDEGRMYPYSESSLSVLNILTKNIKDNIIYERITKIEKKNNKYYLNNNEGFDKVVIAVGSTASLSNIDGFYNILDDLSIKYNKFIPSLVGFKVKENIKSISGVMTNAKVSLYSNNKLVYSETGKVIFKDDGISGICIMNLSSFYQRLDNKNNAYIRVDFYPELKDKLELEGLFNPKLYQYIIKHNINIHDFRLNIKDTYGLKFAQVGIGGISLSELNSDLSLKKDMNIYAGGEVIDIDGLCGGYNLYHAFASAYIIGESISKNRA